MILLVFFLIILHSPEGREIDVSVEEITSLHCKIPGANNKLFSENVNTLINLTDGKHVSVRETCTQVRDAIRKAQEEK